MQVFRDIRSRFPNYRIAVLAVEAPREVILDRAALRGAKTGRFIPVYTHAFTEHVTAPGCAHVRRRRRVIESI